MPLHSSRKYYSCKEWSKTVDDSMCPKNFPCHGTKGAVPSRIKRYLKAEAKLFNVALGKNSVHLLGMECLRAQYWDLRCFLCKFML